MAETADSGETVVIQYTFEPPKPLTATEIIKNNQAYMAEMLQKYGKTPPICKGHDKPRI